MLGQKEGPVEFLCGGNMGFRLSLLLEELKGFQYGSRSDDLEIILRARLKGYRAFFAPDAVVTHDPDRSSLAAIMRHSAKQGASSVLLRRHYRGLLHTPTALMSPACVLLSAPLIALKATAEIFLHNSHLRHFLHTAPVVYLAKVAWCWGASQGLRKSQIATP
jgi:GT2 family glycosyltransferase